MIDSRTMCPTRMRAAASINPFSSDTCKGLVPSAWNASSTPSNARRSVALSSNGPSTTSTRPLPSLANAVFALAPFRTKIRTATPAKRSWCVRCDATRPVAPMMRTFMAFRFTLGGDSGFTARQPNAFFAHGEDMSTIAQSEQTHRALPLADLSTIDTALRQSDDALREALKSVRAADVGRDLSRRSTEQGQRLLRAADDR